MVTVALRGWQMYRQVLKACDVSWRQLPFAEVTPVAFVPWSLLKPPEKELLKMATEQCGGSVEQERLGGQIPSVNIRKKGYFFLADYGVHADLSETDQPSSVSPLSGKSERDRGDTLEDIYSEVSPSSSAAAAGKGGEEEEEETSNTNLSQHPYQAPTPSTTYTPSEKTDAPRQTPNAPKLQDTHAPEQDSNAPGPQDLHDEASPAARPRQDSRASDPADDLDDAVAGSQASPSERTRLVSESGAENIYENVGEAGPEPVVRESQGRPQRLGGEEKGGCRFFTHNYPHPLRARVETLLKEHTHDSDGQGSVMIMYGYTSFLDLAAAQGAIRSGVPVIFDQKGSGATCFLEAVLKDIDLKNEQPVADLLSHNRQHVVNDKDLQTTIDRHSSKLPSFLRYKGLVLHVVRDIVHRRQLLTFRDLSNSLLDAVVEALIKARAGEEAVVFLQKNTFALTTEDDVHPVKSAQKDLQKAVVHAALKLNRPELLEVVMQQGCVNYGHVLSDIQDNNDDNDNRRCLLETVVGYLAVCGRLSYSVAFLCV